MRSKRTFSALNAGNWVCARSSQATPTNPLKKTMLNGAEAGNALAVAQKFLRFVSRSSPIHNSAPSVLQADAHPSRTIGNFAQDVVPSYNLRQFVIEDWIGTKCAAKIADIAESVSAVRR